MVFASPGERRDAVRDAVRDRRGPANVLEEVPGVATGALEAVEQLSAREGRAHLDGQRITSPSEIDVEFFRTAKRAEGPLRLAFVFVLGAADPLQGLHDLGENLADGVARARGLIAP
eukprot:16221570-Heterocapsa_arctica.AAC.1